MDRELKSVALDDLVANLTKIIEELGSGETSAIDVVRDGRVVAVLHPPRRTLHGLMRGKVQVPDGFDLTAPVFEGGTHAEEGRVHE